MDGRSKFEMYYDSKAETVKNKPRYHNKTHDQIKTDLICRAIKFHKYSGIITLVICYFYFTAFVFYASNNEIEHHSMLAVSNLMNGILFYLLNTSIFWRYKRALKREFFSFKEYVALHSDGDFLITNHFK